MPMGERIIEVREAAGLSSEQLARRVGVVPETLVSWESGKFEPRANKLLMLAGVLGVSVLWLAVGDDGVELDGELTELDETRPLKVKVASILSLHEQASRQIFELQADIERLQSQIDDGKDEDEVREAS